MMMMMMKLTVLLRKECKNINIHYTQGVSKIIFLSSNSRKNFEIAPFRSKIRDLENRTREIYKSDIEYRRFINRGILRGGRSP